jgi:hypothetical protein
MNRRRLYRDFQRSATHACAGGIVCNGETLDFKNAASNATAAGRQARGRVAQTA